MHVFLTGQVQIGKSTVIQKTVSLLDLPVGGFRSGFGADRGETERWLYLWDAAGAPAYDERHGVARFTGQGVRVFPERFDEIGGGALCRAREGRAGLILMDECGRLEGQAARFQRELFAALEENTPVLGVVRQGFSGWLDGIRSHPGVTLLTVTAENRDALPRQVARLLQA